MTRRTAAALAGAAVLVAALAWWYGPYWGADREVRSSLATLADDFNAAGGDGVGALARAAQLGSHFTDGVVVDLGPGTAAIEGRDTLIGMAARLEPRTAAFRVALDDVSVEASDTGDSADVTLTVSFIQRNIATDEQSSDAREFALQMQKNGGRWRIARATAIDTFRK
jgi:hypothetical protein